MLNSTNFNAKFPFFSAIKISPPVMLSQRFSADEVNGNLCQTYQTNINTYGEDNVQKPDPDDNVSYYYIFTVTNQNIGSDERQKQLAQEDKLRDQMAEEYKCLGLNALVVPDREAEKQLEKDRKLAEQAIESQNKAREFVKKMTGKDPNW